MDETGRRPDVAEVIAVASELGIHLSEDEAVLYRVKLLDELAEFDKFLQAKVSEDRPPMTSPTRGPGHRPTTEEDPLNAWMWRCEIAGVPGGLLTGKTVSFKDHTAVAGIPLTFGTYAMEGFIPDFDATVVTRVLDAGGTITGKNVMTGLSGGGFLGDYGSAINPHDHTRTANGSSSGPAVAVAAGEVDISFGGDQGGSIRIPASYSGVVGHKPTFGLVSHFGIGYGAEPLVDYVGPLACTVDDVATALQVTAGYDGYDPRQTRDIPLELDVLSHLHDGVHGLRIGVLEEGFEGADPAVTDVCMAALDVFSAAGAVVSKISVPAHHTVASARFPLRWEGALAIFKTTYFGAFAQTYYPETLIAAMTRVMSDQADILTPRLKLSLIAGEFSRRKYYGAVYAKAHNVRSSYIAAYDSALADVDVLVMPTTLTTAPPVSTPESYLAAVRQSLNSMVGTQSDNCAPFNYTGHPALALPVGKSDGLPVSLQLVGRHLDDATLLRAGYAYQSSVDWDDIISVSRA